MHPRISVPNPSMIHYFGSTNGNFEQANEDVDRPAE